MTLVPLCALAVRAVAAGSSSSSHGASHCPESVLQKAVDWKHKCSQESLIDVLNVFGEDGSKVLNLNCMSDLCHTSDICPNVAAPDDPSQCSSHGLHSQYSTWQKALSARASLQWNVLFIIVSLLLGALFRKFNPSWMPYTVSVLVTGIIFGMIAGSLSTQLDCPWKAHVMQPNGVTETVWNNFMGVGFHEDSFCVREHRCGDGSSNPSGCRWKFKDLDKAFSLSEMHAEKQNYDGKGDGQLSADELWTPSCNLLRDMIGLSDIDPHVMLVVFLPGLLFESACFGVDIGIFRTQLCQIVTMAFPAMIVASVLTALLVWATIPQWSFWVCWLIGVISSATDPVAVVALLKDLGAPKSLSTLIEGESLLNDGSAVVLYVWVRNCIGYSYSLEPPQWMSSGRYSGDVGTEFCRVVAQMLVLGVLIGYVFGKTTHGLLRLVYNDRFIEGSIILSMSYLSFWLAELIMGSSAVLAVVIMGLYLNYYKSCISPTVLHFLHQFYEMLAHGLNTIIFGIAGAKLGTLLVDPAMVHTLFTYMGVALGMYPIVLLARGVAIALFFPLLCRAGTGCTWKEAVIIWWGGLRGSVGLALALSVHHTLADSSMWGTGKHTMDLQDFPLDGFTGRWESIDCRDQPAVVLLLTLIVVSLTVIINGMTMAPLMRRLKMTEKPDDRKFMLNEACKELSDKTCLFIEELQSLAAAKGVNWDTVEANVLKIEPFDDVLDEKKAAWLTVLNMERCSYLLQFENSEISSEAFVLLDNHISRLAAVAQITATDELSDLYDEHFKTLLGNMKVNGFWTGKDDYFDVAAAYLTGQEQIQRATNHMSSMFKDIARNRLDNIEDMEKALQDLEQSWEPDLLRKFLDCKYLERVLLKQRSIVDDMQHRGALLDLDTAPLQAILNRKIGRLYLRPVKESVGGRTKLSVIVNDNGHHLSAFAERTSVTEKLEHHVQPQRTSIFSDASTVRLNDKRIFSDASHSPIRLIDIEDSPEVDRMLC